MEQGESHFAFASRVGNLGKGVVHQSAVCGDQVIPLRQAQKSLGVKAVHREALDPVQRSQRRDGIRLMPQHLFKRFGGRVQLAVGLQHQAQFTPSASIGGIVFSDVAHHFDRAFKITHFKETVRRPLQQALIKFARLNKRQHDAQRACIFASGHKAIYGCECLRQGIGRVAVFYQHGMFALL